METKSPDQAVIDEPSMPTGRVLRNVRYESQKVQRRMHQEAGRVITRPRLWRVLTAVSDLVVGFNRLRDDLSLEQVGRHANVPCLRNVGRDLGELDRLGLIRYWPARGRGRHGVVEIPARFAPDVMLRLAPQDSSDVDELPQAGATAGQDVEQAAEKVPESEHVSQRDPYISLPKENPGGSSSTTPAANSAPETGGPATPAISFPPHEVDVVLRRLPDKLRTTPGSIERARQARCIRRLLAAGFMPEQIIQGATLGLPAVVPAPAGLFAFRTAQLMRTQTGRRIEAVRDRQRRRTEREEAERERAAAEALRPQRHQMPDTAKQLLASMPEPVLAAVIGASGAAEDHHVPVPPSVVAERVVAWIQAELDVEHVNSQLLPRLQRTVSGGGSGGVAANGWASRVRTWARRTTKGRCESSVVPLLADAESGEVRCVSCGEDRLDARPRIDLPLETVACDACYQAAMRELSA